MPEEARPWYGRALTVAIALICAGMTVTVGVLQSWPDAVLIAPWTAFLALACWATFWRPLVGVSDAGVRIVNVTRTIDIPWPAVHDVETRWALTLVTAYGRFTAWSAPAPGARSAMRSMVGAGRPGISQTEPRQPPRHRPQPTLPAGELIDTPSGSAAAMVRTRRDALQAAGHLDDPRLERDRALVTWHWGTGLAAAALLVAGPIVAAI